MPTKFLARKLHIGGQPMLIKLSYPEEVSDYLVSMMTKKIVLGSEQQLLVGLNLF